MLFDRSQLRFRSASGFSLAEVLIAIVIITILTIGSLAVYSSQLGRARDTERGNDLSRIKLYLDQFIAQYGSPPGPNNSARRLKEDACKGSFHLMKCFQNLEYSSAEDIKEMMRDPSDQVPVPNETGKKYVYYYGSTPNSYTICSFLEDTKSNFINSDANGAEKTDGTGTAFCLRYLAPGDTPPSSLDEIDVEA
ncbi:MAG: type II secretion system protein [Candidatus Gracilibacteria bacterium]|nr:type II secretion system protein [Candidatus Gracilibacteria bacterium]